MNKGKRHPVLKAALWGGFVFGGFSLLLGLCDAYGPKGLGESIYIVVGPIIGYAPQAVMHVLGNDLKSMPAVLAWLNGSLFGAMINFVAGAAISSVLAVGLQLLSKRSKMRHAESHT
jgi:hypothetical protein